MKFLPLILIVFAFHVSVLGQDKARYKIRSEYCKDNKCTVYAYVAAKDYNETNLRIITEELAVKYKDKEIVNLRVFYDEKIIEAYLKGVREPINILSDSRAYFVHKAGCGDMLFYKLENEKVKLIKLSWKNDENCNKPVIVFWVTHNECCLKNDPFWDVFNRSCSEFMYESILIKVIRVIAIIFSTLFPGLGLWLLLGRDIGIGLNLLLIAAISISGLLISEAINNENKPKN